MAPKVKKLDSELLGHIDMLYKMMSKINVKINLDIKAVRRDLTHLSEKFDKFRNKED